MNDKKFSVLVDLDRLKDPNNGLGQVALLLGRELSREPDDTFEFTFLVPERFNGYFGSHVKYVNTSLLRRYIPQLFENYDLWYTIHQDSWYRPSSRRTPFVITINDLNFLGEKSPEKAQQRLRRLQKKVDRAALVTTISKYTASVVEQNLSLNGKTPRVVYCGVEVLEFPGAARPAFVPDGDLIFAIGVVQPKKNYRVLIDFMSRLPQNYVLVIAGNKSGSHSGELEQEIRDKDLDKRIVLPGMISDEDKYWCYTHCRAIVFPSKLEGMGFPPVEAMRFGKPVFASTFSSIPEISEDKAWYWEHFEPGYMAALFLEKLAEYDADPAFAERLRSHSLRFTWPHAAEGYKNLFREVLGIK